MKDTQILGNNGFTEGFQPRLVNNDTLLPYSTLTGCSHVEVRSYCGETIMMGELKKDEYIKLKTLNKLTNNFSGGDWDIGEVAITENRFIVFIKPLGAKCCCQEEDGSDE